MSQKSKVSGSEIPLQILICDRDEATAHTLLQAVRTDKNILAASMTATLEDARRRVEQGEINTIFIDPLSYDLNIASAFIFETRRKDAEIVFVLYVDKATAESRRTEFYQGERSRFSHYYTLDKRTPIAAFQDEVRSVLDDCRLYLTGRMSKLNLGRLLEKAKQLQAGSATSPQPLLVHEITDLLGDLSASTRAGNARPPKNTVFLSHRFADEEYVDGLTRLLRQEGFQVVTGKHANTFISRAVLDRIRACEFFVCLMTRDQAKADGTYTTSPWLLEEKGAAIALGKPLVLMVEEGVSDYGGLEGDWQRILFGARGFLIAALEAVEQLKTYSGGGMD